MNELVKPGQRYEEVEDPPLDSVRMAWPFKTDEEREAIGKWFREQDKKQKAREKKLKEYGIKNLGKATL